MFVALASVRRPYTDWQLAAVQPVLFMPRRALPGLIIILSGTVADAGLNWKSRASPVSRRLSMMHLIYLQAKSLGSVE